MDNRKQVWPKQLREIEDFSWRTHRIIVAPYPPYDIFLDENGREIHVGALVTIGCMIGDEKDIFIQGIVTYISDSDDGGYPRVRVEWLDGSGDDNFHTYPKYSGPDPEAFEVDDIVNISDKIRNYSGVRGPLRIPYGGYTRHISPEGFAMMPEPKPEHGRHSQFLFLQEIG